MNKPHMLIYLHDNGRQIVTISIDKVDGKWTVLGKVEHDRTELEGWLRFLGRRGHRVIEEKHHDIERSQKLGVPYLAVKPGSTLEECAEGVAWFTLNYVIPAARGEGGNGDHA